LEEDRRRKCHQTSAGFHRFYPRKRLTSRYGK